MVTVQDSRLKAKLKNQSFYTSWEPLLWFMFCLVWRALYVNQSSKLSEIFIYQQKKKRKQIVDGTKD
jgi:hypothetical protein